jgi:hypothetical protein
MKTIPSQILVPVFVGYLTFSQIAQAVIPSPDGGYPNFTTAEGQNALFTLTTGSANTAVGWFSLWSNAENSLVNSAPLPPRSGSKKKLSRWENIAKCSLPSRRSSLSLIEVATVFAPRGLILSRSARPPMPPIANSDRQSA